jgi:formylmethanofuran dehydrogenase subunit C
VSDAVTLTPRAAIEGRLELHGVSPDRFASLTARAIAALPVRLSGRGCVLGDVFTVRGGASTILRVEGDCSAVDGLGADMKGGELLIDGAAGHRTGARLGGGRIEVRGRVGDEGGVAMTGGLLRVLGDAGHRLGGSLPGVAKGMSGGEIVVSGSAGTDVAARARRGLVVVAGNVDAEAARGMIAGSLIVFGRIGAQPGSGNKRGSIVAAGGIVVPETYGYACTYQPPHVRLTMTYLRRRHGLAIDERLVSGLYRRFCGDAGEPGKGEILEWVNE